MVYFLEQLKLYRRALKYRRADYRVLFWMEAHLQKGMTAFDVGAHKGAYTFWMKRANGGGPIVAFEPQESGSVLLRKLFGKRITVETLALSNVVQQQSFFVQPQQNNVSYEASLTDKYSNAQELLVQTTTLDAYCRSKAIYPGFIKIDVEGHEMEVLEGGHLLLSERKPLLLIEIEQRHIGASKMGAIFQYLQQLGYTIYFFDGPHKKPIEEFDPLLHQRVENLNHNPTHYINNFVAEPRP